MASFRATKLSIIAVLLNFVKKLTREKKEKEKNGEKILKLQPL
jgi:hypothetical protein